MSSDVIHAPADAAWLGAARDGDVVALQRMFDSGHAVDAVNEMGLTGLQVAARHGQTTTCIWLLDQGADVNATFAYCWTALHMAALFNQEATCSLLLSRGAESTIRYPSSVASYDTKALEVPTKLLNAINPPSRSYRHRNQKECLSLGWSPLHAAAAAGNVSVCKLLCAASGLPDVISSVGLTPLHVTASFNQAGACAAVLAAGANPDIAWQYKRTALHTAATHDSDDVCRLLLQAGASVDCRDFQSSTPLHMAAHHRSLRVLAQLLAAGADVNAVTVSQVTPLHGATADGRVCALLIAAGANIHSEDEGKDTPLHHSAVEDDPNACALLLEEGADARLCNAMGADALTTAINYESVGCTQLLVAHGIPLPPLPLSMPIPGFPEELEGYVAAVREAGWKRRLAAFSSYVSANGVWWK